MRKIGTAAIVLLIAPAMPAAAQAAKDPLARMTSECAVIARDADRLACYDAAIAEVSPEARAASERRAKETARIAAEEAVVAAAAAKAKAQADAVTAAEARRNAFGAETVTSRGAARFEPGAGEVRTIESTISESFKNSTGFSVFLLENGQLWREVDIPTPINARVGDKVIVEKTALGGYKLNFVRINRAILVKRLK